MYLFYLNSTSFLCIFFYQNYCLLNKKTYHDLKDKFQIKNLDILCVIEKRTIINLRNLYKKYIFLVYFIMYSNIICFPFN